VAKAKADAEKADADTIRATQTENKYSLIENMQSAYGDGLDFTVAYSDSFIDGMVTDKLLHEDDAKEIKAERDRLVKREIDTLIRDGDIETGLEKIKAARDYGYISSTEAEEYGFKLFKANVDGLNRSNFFETSTAKNDAKDMKEQGLLSESDYQKIINYIDTGSYEKAATTSAPGASNTADGSGKDAEKPLQSATTDGSLEELNDKYNVKDEKSYSFENLGTLKYIPDIEKKEIVVGDMLRALNDSVSNAEEGMVVSDGTNIYVYYNGVWRKNQ
jgi:hypothetical protein